MEFFPKGGVVYKLEINEAKLEHLIIECVNERMAVWTRSNLQKIEGIQIEYQELYNGCAKNIDLFGQAFRDVKTFTQQVNELNARVESFGRELLNFKQGIDQQMELLKKDFEIVKASREEEELDDVDDLEIQATPKLVKPSVQIKLPPVGDVDRELDEEYSDNNSDDDTS